MKVKGTVIRFFGGALFCYVSTAVISNLLKTMIEYSEKDSLDSIFKEIRKFEEEFGMTTPEMRKSRTEPDFEETKEISEWNYLVNVLSIAKQALVESSPNKLGGKLVFRGSRVPVSLFRQSVEVGYDTSEFADMYGLDEDLVTTFHKISKVIDG